MVVVPFVDANMGWECAKTTPFYCEILLLYTRLILPLTWTKFGRLAMCPFLNFRLFACLQIAKSSGFGHGPCSSFAGAGRPLCALPTHQFLPPHSGFSTFCSHKPTLK
jgi:hypothetical protein